MFTIKCAYICTNVPLKNCSCILCFCLVQIFRTVPISEFLTVGNPIAEYILTNVAVVTRLATTNMDTRAALRSFASKCSHTLPVIAASITAIADSTALITAPEFSSILECIELCDPPGSDPLDTIVRLVSVPLHEAKEVLAAEHPPSTATYKRFLELLATSLTASSVLAAPIDAYFRDDSSEYTQYLNNFVLNPWLRITTLLFYLPEALWSSIWGYASSGRHMFQFLWSGVSSVNVSTFELRKTASHALKSPFIEEDPIGKQEAAIYRKIVAENVGKWNDKRDSDLLRKALYPTLFTNPAHHKTLARRLKLLMLSHELRDLRKKMPVALLVGPTKAGKSTLREHLRSAAAPDRRFFGGRATQRTSVPEIFVCNADTARPLCVLDTIGLGEQADPEVQQSVRQANDLLLQLASARVIVCAQDDHSALAMNFFAETSSLTEGNYVQSRPTMTCFNRADTVFPGSRYPATGGVTELVQEATDRIKQGQRFDVRTPVEDAYAPRVWASMDALFPIPDYMRAAGVCNAQDVQAWLESVFYP